MNPSARPSRIALRCAAVQLLCTLLLIGCAAGPRTGPEVGPSVAPVPGAPEIDRETQSRNTAAAEHLEQTAASGLNGGDAAAWLAAARAWIYAGNYERAAQNLTHVDSFRLEHRDAIEYELLKAEIAINNADLSTAAEILNALPSELKTAERLAAQALNDRLFAAEQAPAAYIAELLETARRQGDVKRLIALFKRLGALSSDLLQRDLERSADERQIAWIALGREVRTQVAAGPTPAIDLRPWRENIGRTFPDLDLAAALADGFALEYRYPARIAVLLPLAGSLASAATAIQHGLLSAWSRLPIAERPELIFFHLSDNPEDAVGALFEAREANVDWVIGPLNRDAVDRVLAVPGNALPLLLLNRSGNAAAAASRSGLPIYTMALLPEDEAHEAAVMALAEGHGTALVIAGNDTWGERVAAAFAESFTLGGGRVLATGRFDPNANDHRSVLSAVLGLDAAEARRRLLQSRLGLTLGFSPVPRQDAEAIFLAARAARAREIVPQLRFLDAGDIPLYGLAAVLEDGVDERTARDLAGIRFPLAPWLAGAGDLQPARATAEAWFGELATAYGAQLFALGMDALAILPRLALLRGDDRLRFNGANGKIRMDETGEAHRELQAAVISRHGVRLLKAVRSPPGAE